MRFYGVVSMESVVEFLAAREDAETFLAECLADEPDWRDVVSVREFEFEASPN